MHAVFNVYDLIEVLRFKRKLSSRKMAMMADLSPATLASIMSRRAPTISIESLDKIARVFDVRWYDLLNKPVSYAEEFALEDRVSVGMKMKDIDEVGFRLLKDTDTVMLAQKAHDRHNQRVEIAQSIATNAAIRENSEKIPNAPSTSVSPSTEGFRNSLFFVLGKLNDDGLMEAMRRILDVANDPKYCKNKETT